MSKIKRPLLLILFLVGLLLFNAPVTYANPVQPPNLFIIVSNAPSDLEISIGDVKGARADGIIESHFVFYYTSLLPYRISKPSGLMMKVTTGNNTFEITPPPLNSINNVFKLDLKNQAVTQVDSTSVTNTFMYLRIALTLVLEGIVFFFFGFRKISSWIIFVIVNLLTQGGLNIWLNMQFRPTVEGFSNMVLLPIIFGEILVFIVELIVFSLLVKEFQPNRRIYYVLSANLLSLVVGSFLIMMLRF